MTYDPERDELDQLLRQVDDLLAEPGQTDDFDEIQIPDLVAEEPLVYRNFSNNYGQGQSIPAYNPEFGKNQPVLGEYAEESQPEVPVSKPKKEKRKKKNRRGCGFGCGALIVLLLLLIAGGAAMLDWACLMPQSEYSIGTRKDDTATILLCGVDEDGTRTDTIILLYLSGSEKRVSLLSLPRDTYTITSSGKAAKLNSAYGRNGCGTQGAEGLLDYVQDIIGYRPDGYILVDLSLVAQIVDIMGGVYFDVPQDMDVADVAIESGYQHLNGSQVLTLLRFRKGYSNADLGRVQVQRQVIAACLKQWLTPAGLAHVGEALAALESGSITSLCTRNYLWIGRVLLSGMDNMTSDTLPGYAAMRSGASYYILYKEQVAELINGTYNPYQTAITAAMLNIAG